MMRTFFRVQVAIDVMKLLKKGWDVNSVKPFGLELRANGRRNAPTTGQNGLRRRSRLECSRWTTPGKSVDQDEKGKNPFIPTVDCLTIRSTEVLHGQAISNKEGAGTTIGMRSLTYMAVVEKGITILEQKRCCTGLDAVPQTTRRSVRRCGEFPGGDLTPDMGRYMPILCLRAIDAGGL
nr:uncharacterized protein LOC109166477 [Ipomoea batatas]